MSPRRDPIAGQRREREQERREGEMGNEGRETAGKGKKEGEVGMRTGEVCSQLQLLFTSICKTISNCEKQESQGYEELGFFSFTCRKISGVITYYGTGL